MAKLTRPVEVRTRLREALELDLVGPWAGHPLADERLRGWERPSNWYLTGFLVRAGRRLSSGATRMQTTTSRPRSRKKRDSATIPAKTVDPPKRVSFPRRWVLSFLVGESVEALEVTVRWGDYHLVQEGAGRRTAMEAPAIKWTAPGPRLEQVVCGVGGSGLPARRPSVWSCRRRMIQARTRFPTPVGWLSIPSPDRSTRRALPVGSRREPAPSPCSGERTHREGRPRSR